MKSGGGQQKAKQQQRDTSQPKNNKEILQNNSTEKSVKQQNGNGKQNIHNLNKKNKKVVPHSSEIEQDDRFKQVFTDPRFMSVPKKLKNVEIDDRFKKGLASKEFNTVTKVDKYGNRNQKVDNSMMKFYNIDKKDSKQKQDSDDEGSEEVDNKFYDEEGKFKWEAQSSSDEENEEDVEASEQEKDSDDESDEEDINEQDVGLQSGEEDDSVWSVQNEGEEVDEQEVQIGKRLALTNMDWDAMTAVDLFALFSSLCKGDMFISKVAIYPSLFGLEQMKKDSLYGPPKEIMDVEPAKGKKKSKIAEGNEDEFMDDDEKLALGYNSSQLRKYEIQKMKYYYAVVHCSSKKTAKQIYDEYNNFEFELSNIRLSLSFIADDLKFPQAPKEVATEIPAGYQFRTANTMSKALNHTNVKFTWDQTDPKRLQKFQKLMEKDESDVDEEDYREFLASASEDEADYENEDQDQEKIEEYRKKLLGALSTATGDISEVYRTKDLQGDGGDESNKKELDIRFNVGFGEDVGKKLLKEKKEKKDLKGESDWTKYQRKRKEIRKEKKENAKQKKKQGQVEIFEDENDEQALRRKAQLEMLVGKKNNGLSVDFKPDTKDKRFEAVLKNKEFALDPTNKNFRKVADGEFMKEQKIKRRKMHDDE